MDVLKLEETFFNIKQMYEGHNNINNSQGSIDQFSSIVDLTSGAVFFLKEYLEGKYGAGAVATMATKTSGFALGTLSFELSLTKFGTSLSQFNNSPYAAIANVNYKDEYRTVRNI